MRTSEQPKRVYRVYRLDMAGRINEAARVLHAESDAEAEQQARAMVDGHAVELWSGDRLLMTINKADGR